MNNIDLHEARSNKNDEFYTQIIDIKKELKHYKDYFKGKIVFCNCDNPESSNFWQYFSINFNYLGIKKLIATYYDPLNHTYKIERTAMYDNVKITPLHSNGDFRSEEVVNILKESDVVVTNPPFSLFREYIAQLIGYFKDFLIIGNINAITYKEIFPYIKNNQLWFGPSITSGDREFRVPDYYPMYATGSRIDEDGKKYIRVKGVRWFTNLNHSQRNQPLELYRSYHNSKYNYPNYDNYNAINIDKVKDIPRDYENAMGVPITFLDKYNPHQFEILNANDFRINKTVPFKSHGLIKDKDGTINGKATYVRILIRRI